MEKENVECDVLITNGKNSKIVRWNGEDMVGANDMDRPLFDDFWNDDGLGEHLDELFETGKLIRPKYRMEIL